MELDEAIAILIELLRAGRAGQYGYDLYARNGAGAAALRLHQQDHQERERMAIVLTPIFLTLHGSFVDEELFALVLGAQMTRLFLKEDIRLPAPEERPLLKWT
jgi:hypothetical protein